MQLFISLTRIYSGYPEAAKEKLDPSRVKVRMTGTSVAEDDA